MIESIKIALIAFVEMEQIYHRMIVYLKDKKLI